MNILFLMISLSMTLGTASTALVSRAFGAQNKAEYRRASRQSLRMALLAGLALAALTAIIAPFASRLLLPPQEGEAVRQMTVFIWAFAAGMPSFFIIQTLAGSLRGLGDTKSPMVISGVQILLHIVFNFILIYPTRTTALGITVPGAGLGLLGAGIALSSSAWICALVYISYLGRTPLRAFRGFRLPDWSWVVRILRIATPAAFMAILRVASLTSLTLVVKGVPNGATAIAAMGLAFSIEGIMFMPAFGFSVAAAALVGQSLGMRRPDRAERLGWMSGHFAAILVAALVLPIFLMAKPFTSMMVGGEEPTIVASAKGPTFQDPSLAAKPGLASEVGVNARGQLAATSDDPAKKRLIADEAANLLRYMCATELLFAYAMVMIGALQGAGDTVRPMWITIVALWGLRVPLAVLLAVLVGMGASGVWLAITISQAVQGLLAMAAFKQGAWKLKEV